MTTTAVAKSRPLRLNQRAELVPTEQFARWYAIASATAGLTDLDRRILDVIAAYYRLLHERGDAPSLTLEKMAHETGVRTIDVGGAIKRLVGLALVAVKPGSGRWANEYLPALPKRLAASITPAAAGDDVPPI